MGAHCSEVVESLRRVFFQSLVWVVKFWNEGMEKALRLPEALVLMKESMEGALRDGFQVAIKLASCAIAEDLE